MQGRENGNKVHISYVKEGLYSRPKLSQVHSRTESILVSRWVMTERLKEYWTSEMTVSDRHPCERMSAAGKA